MTSSTNPRCHNCGSISLRTDAGYSEFWRVTSDCKPWPAGGVFAWCNDCGLVQTGVDDQWQQDCQKIYDGYTIYHQSGGIEQPVFAANSGAGRSRSETIVQALLKNNPLPAKGRLLDVGCGNGAFLRACSQALPDWSLCGSEVNDKYKREVEGIRGVERLFTGDWKDIPGTFDLISLIHVLEHIPSPSAFLKALASKLNPNGLLLLEVPDCSQNFFTLLVADHCSHFSQGMLGQVSTQGGFEVLHAVNSWVPKEVTVLARPSSAPAPRPVPTHESEQVFRGCRKLAEVMAQVAPIQAQEHFGIFGTSIAATWLQAQTGHAAKFFVDEDQNRVGQKHLGKPIVGPTQLSDRAIVFIALPPVIGAAVATRLKLAKPQATFVLPAG